MSLMEVGSAKLELAVSILQPDSTVDPGERVCHQVLLYPVH